MWSTKTHSPTCILHLHITWTLCRHPSSIHSNVTKWQFMFCNINSFYIKTSMHRNTQWGLNNFPSNNQTRKRTYGCKMLQHNVFLIKPLEIQNSHKYLFYHNISKNDTIAMELSVIVGNSCSDQCHLKLRCSIHCKNIN